MRPSRYSRSTSCHHLNKLLWAKCYIPSHKVIDPLVPEFQRKFLTCFYNTWAWLPSWSCGQDNPNKLSFPLLMDIPHVILALIGQLFRRRCCFKGIGHFVLEMKIYDIFDHTCIWVWWPSWSCDPVTPYKLSSSQPLDVPHIIWL